MASFFIVFGEGRCRNMRKEILKTGFVVALVLAVSAYAADACNDEMGHVGEGKKVIGTGSESVKGDVGNSGFQYELWHSEGSGSLTYYDNGTFSAEWSNSQDFIARVGLRYAESKNFDEFGNFSADFKFTKSGSADFSYIGVYGWTDNPRADYFILEDWFSEPNPEYLGEKKGEITVDGDTYDIYSFKQNKLYVQGDVNYPTFYSVRRIPRQCGHIDITAHFKKWTELGLNLGKMNEVMMVAEAGNGSATIDFTYFNVTESEPSSPAPSSSSATPESSFAVPASDALVESSSSVTQELKPAAKSSESTTAIVQITRISPSDRSLVVFDMQGRVLGQVFVPAGVAVNSAIFAKFGKSGVYMVQSDGGLKVLSVTK